MHVSIFQWDLSWIWYNRLETGIHDSSNDEDDNGREPIYTEDGEYESVTSSENEKELDSDGNDSDLDEGCTNIRLAVPPPVPKRVHSYRKSSGIAKASVNST